MLCEWNSVLTESHCKWEVRAGGTAKYYVED